MNFAVIYFKDNLSMLKKSYAELLDEKTRSVMLWIANWFERKGIPFVVTCLDRSIEYNEKIGGNENSYHVLENCKKYGVDKICAFDFQKSYKMSDELKDMLKSDFEIFSDKYDLIEEKYHWHVERDLKRK